MARETASFGRAKTGDLYRFAVDFSDAIDRCTQTGGATIDELMEFWADDAVRTRVGGEPQIGKEAIRAHYLRRVKRLQQVVEIQGIELWGDMIICRGERRDTTIPAPDKVQHNLRILIVKNGKVKHDIIILDPDEYEELGTTPTP